MTGEGVRRLAAILMADIAGYSRLMGADEKGTHLRVQRLFRELIEPTIAEHRGRLIKTSGDSFFAMFDSPVEAVRCAIVVQQSMVGRNLEQPSAQWIRFRIGVNLGDVIVEDGDVFGEGVNVASRLEQLAEPGNIYISGGVYEQIRYKLVCGYQSLGDRKVKNIVDPVPIYRVLPDPASLATATRGRLVRFGLIGATAIIVAGGLGLGVWNNTSRRLTEAVVQTPSSPIPQSSGVGAVAGDPAPPMPARAPAPPPDTQAVAVPRPPQPPQTEASPSAAVPTAPPRLPPAAEVQVAPTPPRPPPVQTAINPVIPEPEMIPIAAGTLRMGSNQEASEQPIHNVRIAPFLLAKYLVTVGQWRACVAAKGCTYTPEGNDDAPVNNVSWDDAKQFAAWLSRVSHQPYRLPSEAEWEYAARAGTDTRYWWGNTMKPGVANCTGCDGPHDAAQPTKIGALPANPFGVSDIGGGLTEWVEDCWHKDYHNAPTDGTPWSPPDCRERVLRGGSWRNNPSYVRTASRDYYDASVRYPTHGVRLARSQ